MAQTIPASIVLLSVLLSLTLAQKRVPCKDICRFNRCNVFANGQVGTGLGRLSFPPASTGFIRTSPVICENNIKDTLGYILKTSEPILELLDGSETKLKKWKPAELSDPFPGKFFFTDRLEMFRRSGITRKEAKGNQLELLQDLCVRIPILQYEKVKKKGRTLKKVIKTKKGDKSACVSFRSSASRILVQLQWKGRDDLDLRVTQPDGQRLDRFNKGTTDGAGKFFEEGGSDNCFGGVEVGREGVVFRGLGKPEPMKGTYTVEISHFDNCGAGGAEWELSVMVDGQVVIIDRGLSDEDFSKIVYTNTFEF